MTALRALAAAFATVAIAGCDSLAKPSAMTSRELPGTSWVGVVPETIARGQEPQLQFASGGKLTGYTGCNRLSGSYTIYGDRLEIVAFTTKRACAGEGSEVERRFLAVVTGSPRFLIDARGLTIANASGERFEFLEALPPK